MEKGWNLVSYLERIQKFSMGFHALFFLPIRTAALVWGAQTIATYAFFSRIVTINMNIG
jgi:hypothetical protein